MRYLASAGVGLSMLALAAANQASAAGPDVFIPGGGGAVHSSPGGPQHGFGGAQAGRPGFGGGGQRFNGGGQRFGGDYRRRGGGYGGAIGAGIAGLAAGAVIGGAVANRSYYGDGYDGYGYDNGYAAPARVYVDPGAEADDVEPVPAQGNSSDYCASRYRSYDPGSGTYLGYDGYRHPCQ